MHPVGTSKRKRKGDGYADPPTAPRLPPNPVPAPLRKEVRDVMPVELPNVGTSEIKQKHFSTSSTSQAAGVEGAGHSTEKKV